MEIYIVNRLYWREYECYNCEVVLATTNKVEALTYQSKMQLNVEETNTTEEGSEYIFQVSDVALIK